jgi:nitrite reductase (NO-forming)
MRIDKLVRILVLCALLAGAVTACSDESSSNEAAKATPAEAAQAGGEVNGEASSSLAGGPILGTLAFEGSELHFQPATVEVAQAGRYAVTFTNVGHTDHDWAAGDLRLVAKPGETASGEIVVPAEGLGFVCSFPGHAAGGMAGRIVVNGETGE